MPPGSNRKQAASLAIQGAASSINNQMNYLKRANNFNTMMLRTDERDATKKMQEIDGRLTTMKSMQKIVMTCSKEFTD